MIRILILACAFALIAPAGALAEPSPTAGHRAYALELVRQTDLAARRTNACRSSIGSSPFTITRAYARVESVPFRLWARHLWRTRRAACAVELAKYQRDLGVPSWFREVMLCIHPKESSDWFYNGSSGYDGGLQFAPSTWDSAMSRRKTKGLGSFSAFAYQASPAEQIRGAWDLTDGSVDAISHHWPQTHIGCV